jgi:hypothetical protein
MADTVFANPLQVKSLIYLFMTLKTELTSLHLSLFLQTLNHLSCIHYELKK